MGGSVQQERPAAQHQPLKVFCFNGVAGREPWSEAASVIEPRVNIHITITSRVILRAFDITIFLCSILL